MTENLADKGRVPINNSQAELVGRGQWVEGRGSNGSEVTVGVVKALGQLGTGLVFVLCLSFCLVFVATAKRAEGQKL